MGIRNTGTKEYNLKNGVNPNFGLGSKTDLIIISKYSDRLTSG